MMAAVIIEQKVFNHDAQGSGFEPLTHVDLGIDFRRFLGMQANSYILEGIRGTGKTHILKMIINEIQDNFEKYSVVPAFVTVAAAPEVCKKEAKYFRIFLYTSVIKNVCKFIVENKKILKEKKADAGLVNQIKSLFGFYKEEADLEENINKILGIADSIIRELSDNPDRVIKSSAAENSSSASASINLIKPLNISGEDKSTLKEEEVKEYATKKLSEVYGVDILLSFLRTVKNTLGLNYIYLLFDECSESTKDMQIETFRLCKQIRASCSNNNDLNKPDVAFIAAVYPPQSTYYPSINKGDDFNFQPGHDCSPEYLELDELNEEFESFFLQLMENRLKLNNGYSKLLLDFFESKDPILIAAYCSGGVPRRFLEIVKQAYSQLSRDFTGKQTPQPKKINSEYIIGAVAQVVESPALINNSSLEEQDKVVLEKILKRFAHRNKSAETRNKSASGEKRIPMTIYFTTAAKSSRELANLISIGLIHDKKRSRSRKSGITAWEGAGILCSLDIGLAIHRGILSRVPSRIVEICQKEIKLSAYRGFTYVLDILLEEESLDIELDKAAEYIQILEGRLLELDKAFLDKIIDEKAHTAMVGRTSQMLEAQKKRYEKLKEKIKSNTG